MIGVGLIFLINRFGNDRIYSGMWIFYGILIVFLVGLVIQRFAIYKLGMHIIPFAKDLMVPHHGITFQDFHSNLLNL